MQFDVLTLFPEMFEPLEKSILGRAKGAGKIDINLINIIWMDNGQIFTNGLLIMTTFFLFPEEINTKIH